ncbi:MAG: MMPL family transporter [Gammaproteobacteria bacterium]|nr:MMPL family transporter [Gammaproteobacteria bacterium]
MINFYLQLVLKKPLTCLLLVFLITLSLGWFTQYFRLDASSDTLVVEGDTDLELSRQTNDRYNTSNFVFISYNPTAPLFEATSLDRLRALKDRLELIDRVSSVQSIFSVPLLKVAGVPLSELADNIKTLDDPDVDLQAARDDLSTSVAYRDVLLSEDAETTALIVNFAETPELDEAAGQRALLRVIPEADRSRQQQIELTELEIRYRELNTRADLNQHNDIAEIRSILDEYRTDAVIVMGGVPMIADDLITFVKNDLQTFGLAILVFIIITLGYLFREVRYIGIPLTSCAVTLICIVGLLGLLDWPVTVISSNFISLLLIITISLNVHLIVRYRELEVLEASMSHQDRIKTTLQNMVKPCAYTSFTTIVAFGSLVSSQIPPIINFGLMMVIGVALAFLLTFLVFPALMSLMQENKSSSGKRLVDVTPYMAALTAKFGKGILVVASVIFVFSVAGLNQLEVENSFIDYFDESTEIYQGMVSIDQNMGGTTPLDVIINLYPEEGLEELTANNAEPNELLEEDEFFFEEEFNQDDEAGYWFTTDKMELILAIHNYLDELPETGKILSLGTVLQVVYELNDDEPLDNLELAVLYGLIPQDYKNALITPYVSIENDQVRFAIRVLETNPDLVRNELLENIRAGLQQEFDLSLDQVQLTGMFVLYNNMLLSLFDSQILTLSLVLAVIFIMFIILFRSLKLAVLGILPNILAASAVLGLMGWMNIPLDMMTITIAAISVGIGVDNTIHYIHRFKVQFPKQQNYQKTMKYCHSSIGQAMYYTSFTIIVGFSILVFSNFIPTIYFGLLTSLAMFIALTGALTLLPQLLITFKPLGKEVI